MSKNRKTPLLILIPTPYFYNSLELLKNQTP